MSSRPIIAPKPHVFSIAPYIRDCAVYQPGKPIDELERELGIKDIIKLASNENPLGASAKALAAIQAGLSEMHLYPDAVHYRLRDAIADRNGLSRDEVYIGNGSEEIFSVLIRTFCLPGDKIVSCAAAFLAYRVCAQVHGVAYAEPKLHQNIASEIQELLSLVDEKTRVVFLPNPNNPTGTYLPTDVMENALLELQKKNVLVVLDYAYQEYARAKDLPDSLELYKKFPNVIVTRTFSKIYGLGGLRVGYAFGHPDLLNPMRKVKMPFNVTNLGLCGALAALEDEAHLKRSVETNAQGLEYLEKEFTQSGFSFWPSQGNFLLVKMPKDAMKIFDGMLREGVILRPVAGYGLKEYLRITVGTMPQNKRMMASLKKVIQGFS